MFNLKEQDSLQPNLSADDILSNIKRRLGLSEETNSQDKQQQDYDHNLPYKKDLDRTSNNTPPADNDHNHPSSCSTQSGDITSLNATSNELDELQDTAYESESTDAIDDDFSFDLDFDNHSSPTDRERNANNAYRAYQNSMQSSYKSDAIADAAKSTLESQNYNNDCESQSTKEEDFSFDDDISLTNADNTPRQNAESNTLDDEDNTLHADNNDSTDEDYEDTDNQSYQDDDYNSMGDIAMSIERTLSVIAREEVHAWCQDHLENICRNIIQEELSKK
ncbi:MAG: hypothetical protein ACI9CD_000448 [Candidatus Deianiraeaceae bacterium]|jgi:hypothetical protein